MEPKWRTLLCWGAVVTFLCLPLTIFVMSVASQEFGFTKFHEHIRDYKFLGSFYQSITALAFGLSGLRSVDKYVETRNGNGQKSHPEKP